MFAVLSTRDRDTTHIIFQITLHALLAKHSSLRSNILDSHVSFSQLKTQWWTCVFLDSLALSHRISLQNPCSWQGTISTCQCTTLQATMGGNLILLPGLHWGGGWSHHTKRCRSFRPQQLDFVDLLMGLLMDEHVCRNERAHGVIHVGSVHMHVGNYSNYQEHVSHWCTTLGDPRLLNLRSTDSLSENKINICITTCTLSSKSLSQN